MKKLLLTTVFICATIAGANAQQLSADDFDGLTVGDVGTDLTGATAGQGNWYTIVAAGGANSNFQIVTEAGRGNVLTIQSTDQPPVQSGSPSNARTAINADFNTAKWNTRSAGNNILRVEFDIFTGARSSSKASHRIAAISANRIIGGLQYEPETGLLRGIAWGNGQNGPALLAYTLGQSPLILNPNTWYKVAFLVDYGTNKIWFQIPDENFNGSADIISVANEAPAQINLMAISGAGNTVASTMKYDNYIVSAVNTTAASVNDVISSKFNLYPNPVNDVVTISNEEHIAVNNVSVIDMNGRVVKTFEFNNQSQVQMNISDLKAGIYIFKISTNEGTASKKVVKK